MSPRPRRSSRPPVRASRSGSTSTPFGPAFGSGSRPRGLRRPPPRRPLPLRPMRPRKTEPRAGPTGPDANEISGFLEGVRHRLLERRRAGAAVPDLEQRLADAQAFLASAHLAEAERVLLDVSDRLDHDEPEPELIEFPRGLVRYDAGTDRGVPTPEDEEPVGNRLTLIERLLTVAASEGVEVGDLRGLLR